MTFARVGVVRLPPPPVASRASSPTRVDYLNK